MDALLPAFVTAALAEMGDRTQLLAILLAAHHRRPGLVLGAIAGAALVNSLLASFGGVMLHDFINGRAITLMLGVGLILAGAGGFWRPAPPTLASYGSIGAFANATLGFFILEFGDKTQLLTATIAARTDSLGLTAIGATLGIVAANLPAVLLGPQWQRVVPLRAIRAGIGVLFVIVGLVVVIGALRLG